MGRRHRRRHGKSKPLRLYLSVCAVALVLLLGVVAAQQLEDRMKMPVENAGRQMTARTEAEKNEQVLMNGRRYERKPVETLLVIGFDEVDAQTGSASHSRTKQADFMMLFVKDAETGESAAIHLNREMMTDIALTDGTGQTAEVQNASLAQTFSYGQNLQESGRNTADAVSRLLHGMEIDCCITLSMEAVPMMNDWAGGVTVEILENLTWIDPALAQGIEVTLSGEQALHYMRAGMELDDSANMKLMERQRQYIAAWIRQAESKMNNPADVVRFVADMKDYCSSDCTADEIAEFAGGLSNNLFRSVYEIPGEAAAGAQHREYYADDEKVQQLVLELFYEPVN